MPCFDTCHVCLLYPVVSLGIHLKLYFSITLRKYETYYFYDRSKETTVSGQPRTLNPKPYSA